MAPSEHAIALDNSLAYGEINDLKEQLAREKVYLEDEIRTEMQFHDIILTGAPDESPAVQSAASLVVLHRLSRHR
jgi:hypothetical protein